MQILPTKFESILRNDTFEFAPLIVKVDADLARFRKVVRFNQAQDAGTLTVISSPPGQGKTTSAYAATVLLRKQFMPVLSVPAAMSVPLREIPAWLMAHLPPKAERTTIVLIDGRESTDDEQGLKDVMGALNNLVRGRPDLMFVWPTTDATWRDRLVATARSFGSKSFCPEDAVFSVEGPAKSQWIEAVGLALEQLGSNWDEFGINEASAEELLKTADTLGEFLTAVNQVRVDQEEFSENVTGLPEVVFVISSHSEVVGHVARLRNPETYRIRTDELISSAPRSEPGKFWKARGAKQKSNLAWVSSLLQVKVLALTPSTVAHACGINAKPGSRLRETLQPLEFKADNSTGLNAFKTTDLARFLDNQPVPETLASNKGSTSRTTLDAYDAIQALSRFQHRAINESILTSAGKWSGKFGLEDVQFELGLGGDAIVDAIAPAGDRRVHLEFNHVSQKNVSPNEIAKYIMKKLRVYATQYNLIER